MASKMAAGTMLLLAFGLLCGSVQGRSPFLELVGNGYKNLVVALSPDVPKDNVVELLDFIKTLFTQTSLTLYKATRRKVYLKEVTVLLPEHWRNFPDGFVDNVGLLPASYETYEEADFRVEAADENGYNPDPSTVRTGGCGEPGEYIRLSTKFVTSVADAIPKAKALVREWAQYRYGVFDECGIPGDPNHPIFYITPRNNSIAPTSCVNTEVLPGKIEGCTNGGKDILHDPTCNFLPDLQSEATSSLMYMPHLPKVTEFCDVTTHNRLAPTKHNVLCRERSVWEVINQSPDFQNLQEADFTEDSQTTPTFRILKAVNSAYVIAVDTSSNVEQSTFQAAREALESFIDNDVPNNNALAIVEFRDVVVVHRALTLITENSRRKFKNGLPRLTNQNAPVADAAEALRKAVYVSWQAGNMHDINVRKVIVMVTAGQWKVTDAQDVDSLCAVMTVKKVRLDVLLLQPPTNREAHAAIQKLIHCSGGSLRVIAADEFVGAVQEIGAGLRESLKVNSESDRVLRIHSQHNADLGAVMNGFFYVDSSVGANTTFLVTYKDKNDMQEIEITSPNGTVYRTNDDEYYPGGSNSDTFKFPRPQTGKWTYQITKQIENSDRPIGVDVTSQASAGEPLRVRCWTNMAAESVVVGSTPVIIYTQVMQGQYSVVGAAVEAEIELPRHETIVTAEIREPEPEIEMVPNPEISSAADVPVVEGAAVPEAAPAAELQQEAPAAGAPEPLEQPQALASTVEHHDIKTKLYDDGSGDPDITTGDGIYSSYLTKLPKVGFYTINVRVTSTAASRLQKEKETSSKRKLTGEFQRLTVCTSLYVAHVASEDNIPPARITNLRLESKDSVKGEAIISWTAVGDDYHEGLVEEYAIYMDANREHFREDDLSQVGKRLEINDEIQPPRTKQMASILIPVRNKLFYIAVRGRDNMHNTGKTSNIIGVVMPEVPIPTPPPVLPTVSSTPLQLVNDTVDKEKTQTASVGAGAIVGIVIAAVLIVVIVAIVFVVTTKRRREEERRRKAKSQRYSSVPKEEGDEGGFKAENSHTEDQRRESQSKGMAASNTSV